MYRPSRFVAAAVAALGAAFLSALPTYAEIGHVAISANRKRVRFNGAVGETVARAKRRAKKHRNQLRHKRAMRR